MHFFTYRNRFVLASFLGFACASSSFASATLTTGGTLTGNHSGYTSSVPGALVSTFDNLQMPLNYTEPFGNALISSNQSKGPAGDTSPYLTTQDGEVAISFAKNPIKYFGLFWGDIQADNAVAFTNTAGKTYSYTGVTLTSFGLKDNGTQSAYVNFFAGAGEQWTSVILSSLRCDPFVFDNVASSTAPEPSSFLTAGLGMGLAALGIVRRRRSLGRQ